MRKVVITGIGIVSCIGNNKSDVLNGILQRNNIHLATCGYGEVISTLNSLRASAETAKAKCKFILATDGDDFQAENLNSGDTDACNYRDLANHFGFFRFFLVSLPCIVFASAHRFLPSIVNGPFDLPP